MTKWVEINWRKAYQQVYNFQKKIYAAAIYQDLNSVSRLQDFFFTDQIARLVAIQQSWQETGHKYCLNCCKLEHQTNQNLFKLGFDPQAEAQFPASQYGFRFGRSSSDGVAAILKTMGKLEKHMLKIEFEICNSERFLQVTLFNSGLAQKKRGQHSLWTERQLPSLKIVPLFLNIVLINLLKQPQLVFSSQTFTHFKSQCFRSYPSLISFIVYRQHLLIVSSSLKKLLQTYAGLRSFMILAGLTSKKEEIGGCSAFFFVNPGMTRSCLIISFHHTLNPTLNYIGLNFCYPQICKKKGGKVLLPHDQLTNHLSQLKKVVIKLYIDVIKYPFRSIKTIDDIFSIYISFNAILSIV